MPAKLIINSLPGTPSAALLKGTCSLLRNPASSITSVLINGPAGEGGQTVTKTTHELYSSTPDSAICWLSRLPLCTLHDSHMIARHTGSYLNLTLCRLSSHREHFACEESHMVKTRERRTESCSRISMPQSSPSSKFTTYH